MLDIDTFLITLYVTIDDFCRERRQSELEPVRPGPEARLSPSEVMTLALFGQLSRFRSERDFYRFAKDDLGHLFPNLPDRVGFNRHLREQQEAIVAFFHHLTERLEGKHCAFEIVDRVGAPTRFRSRRGVGWLPEYTDKGWCGRLGWFHGFHLLTVVNPEGVITGIGIGPASAKDQPLMDAVLQARHTQDPRCPLVGTPALGGDYIADAGFIGEDWERRWRSLFDVGVTSPPRPCDAKKLRWPKALRRWHASLRQIIESVHDKLLNTFRLDKERPHDIRGFFARVSAKVALHNFCIWINRQYGRQPMQFADLIGW